MSPASMEKAMHPAGLKAGRSLLLPKRCQQMRTPGVEPGSQAWEACMMPLHYVRCWRLKEVTTGEPPLIFPACT